MINVKCSCSGYTLLEILAVVTIMAFSAALMAPVVGDKGNRKRMERTLESMEEIKKAILGTHSVRLREDARFAGYVPDMGGMPDLIHETGKIVMTDGQPKGLWTTDLDGDGEDDLPLRQDYSACDYGETMGKGCAISLGWRGPYLKTPADDRLKDAWGTPFVFEFDDASRYFTIKSLGADGKEGGMDLDKDILLNIRDTEYLAPVAGYVSPYTVYKTAEDLQAGIGFQGDVGPVTVRIYYAPKPGYGPRQHSGFGFDVWDIADGAMDVEARVDKDGYFTFDGKSRAPVGTQRLLAVVEPVEYIVPWENPPLNKGDVFQPYKIDIAPGINWLGNMGSIH